MRFTRKIAIGAVAVGIALGLAACSGGDDGVTIGIKFDQPGLGLKEGANYTGFDVDTAKYVANELGYKESDITWKESPSAQRENLIKNGQVKMVFATYSITDARKAEVGFAGPYLVAGQDLLVKADNTDITGPDTLAGKKLCSVTGSTSAKNVQEKFAQDGAVAGVRHVQQVRGGPEQRRDRRTDHRQHDPRRLCVAAGEQGQAQGRRQALLHGELRCRAEEG